LCAIHVFMQLSGSVTGPLDKRRLLINNVILMFSTSYNLVCQ
jgi:hypothetical protein